MKKAQLRDRFIELRRDMKPRRVESYSAKIFQTLIAAIDWDQIKRAHVYRSVDDWNEVRTDDIVRYLRTEHPNIALTIGDPVRSVPAPTETFDVILIPLLAFDGDCNRLGFGGGWYDRFLAIQPKALKVGLAYAAQQTESVPVESHDVPLDMVVTESAIVKK